MDRAQPLRAPVWWYGGKGNLRARLAPLVPHAHGYVEPYGGAASLLFYRPPSPCEVYNDLNADLVNLFRYLQDPATYPELEHRLRHTLHSRDELIRAREWLRAEDTHPVERAWAFFVAMNQGFSGSLAKSAGNWARTFISANGMASVTNKWIMRLAMLPAWHLRLARVQIDHRCALEVIRYWDREDFVFYCDPPYPAHTRVKGNTSSYAHEADDDHHRALVEVLLTVRGAAVLSAYDSPLYDPLAAAGWTRTEFKTACYAAGRGRDSGLQGAGAALKKVPRTEVVWQNPSAVALCAGAEPVSPFPLFPDSPP